jgi:hypothetical protein
MQTYAGLLFPGSSYVLVLRQALVVSRGLIIYV